MKEKKPRGATLSAMGFFERFPDEDAARIFIEQCVWEGGEPTCPNCESKRHGLWKTRKGHYRCKDCRKIYSVKNGAVFENSHIPLRSWLYAFYRLHGSRKGIPSTQLADELGITQKSAWYLLHRIRTSCMDDRLAKLSGEVEMDATYIGGKERNKHADKKGRRGRGPVGKQPVLGIRDRRTGEVRAVPVDSESALTVCAELPARVEPGTEVITDDHPAYRHIKEMQYSHSSVKHSVKEFVRNLVHTNGIESVWALLKRAFKGVYHHWSTKHCHRYLDELTFRLNKGGRHVGTLDFLRALCKGAIGKRLTYASLTKG
ncbi:MAG: IS1595 family transposase [Betaproteobacteria bacterium AqS2]|uniref:IS1595 family transposase n=1 Tax=Candidatus Amphirhobacter heronislandensis TaxID=1732024 RepID=A0A930UF28_9GAMM|nr:IS1595 family transposase [Betaproteobacteria bacterium AqS2]